MESPKMKPKWRLSRREKWKKKMLKYGREEGMLDCSESNGAISGNVGTLVLRSNSTNMAMKSVETFSPYDID